MRKNFAKMMAIALLAIPFGLALPTDAAAMPYWDVSGDYVMSMEYLGGDYPHDMTLVQDGAGDLTGNGGSPAGSNVYTWVITSGSVEGNDIEFFANYTATPDAVVPQTVLHVVGTVAMNGTMSGTWSDNYQGGDRSGTWTTTSGSPVLLGELSAEDFGVVDYDTGATGQLAGYTAGFGLTDATLEGATSVVVELYAAGDQLLQTNTAIFPKFNNDITGTQFSSPFDVSGDFDYVLDGYWTNDRETEFGQSVPATKVVATVTLANGKVVTAENTNLVGDPTTIYPEAEVVNNPTTDPATNVTSTDATLNGTNGDSNATGHSFWASLNTFSTASPTIPAGVYSTVDLGPVLANTSFSAPLSGMTGMPAITPNTTYYFVAWSYVDGTWYPGEILTLTTSSVTPPVNTAPVLSNVPASPVSIPELALYSFDANATDADLPSQTLIFSLSGTVPAGAVIDASTGVFTWTPSEAQGPGSYTFDVVVSDGSLIDTQSITINVTEVTDPVPPTPLNKDDCKKGGWVALGFKNQGQCVSSVVSNR